MLVLLFQFFLTRHDCRVAVFDSLVVFVFHVHVLTHFRVGGSGSETAEHIHHVVITFIFVFVDIEYLLVVNVFLGLVEYAEYLFKAVVHPSFEERYLHYDTVVRKALDKRFFLAVLNHFAVVVINIMVYVNHGFLYVAHPMTEQVNGHHGIGKALGGVVAYVNLVAVLCSEILAEAKSLCVQPCLLQFYQNNAVFQFAAVRFFLADCGSKIYAEH